MDELINGLIDKYDINRIIVHYRMMNDHFREQQARDDIAYNFEKWAKFEGWINQNESIIELLKLIKKG